MMRLASSNFKFPKITYYKSTNNIKLVRVYLQIIQLTIIILFLVYNLNID